MTTPAHQNPERHRVVVIGSGFGGLFATQGLKRADVDVTIIAGTFPIPGQRQHGHGLPVQCGRASRTVRVQRLCSLAALARRAPRLRRRLSQPHRTLLSWTSSFLGRGRGQLTTSAQQIRARAAVTGQHNQIRNPRLAHIEPGLGNLIGTAAREAEPATRAS